MNWLQNLLPARIRAESGVRKAIPEGLWDQCKGCGATLYRNELEKTLMVCPKCDFHMRITARTRLNSFLDPDSMAELGAGLTAVDTLKFKDSKKYKERITKAQKDTGEKDALLVMRGRLFGMDLVAAAFEFGFMGGSMGAVVGEKFSIAANCALENKIPLVCFSTSGGARMQEGLFSLFQMAKTSSLLAQMKEVGLPYISVLTDPTTGGVSASLAMLGDINIAEPGALIGFAGPRVIEQTVRQTLPEGFQRSEFLLDHGVIDQIVDRREMRQRLADLLSLLTRHSVAV